MIRRVLFVGILLVCGVSTAAIASSDSTWPLQGQDETSPQVVAAYQQQCDQWATESEKQGSERDSFLSQCMENISKVWTVGFEADSGE
jgi:predicted metalloprotease